MRRNYRKVIKNWKVVRNGLDSVTAFNMFKAQAIQGTGYDLLAIRLHGRVFQPGIVDIDREQFIAKDILSNDWEAIIPDDDMEEILEKMRDMFKEEHIGNLTYQKIDNMSINDLWIELSNILYNLDDRNKYRMAKWIIENKVYKKQ
jgi:hypothetical protein